MVYRRTEQVARRAQTKRSTIVQAAQNCVASGGFASATVRTIAESSDVASGTVYRYFPSREELLAEVFRSFALREFNAVKSAVDNLAGDTRSQLVAFIATFARRAFANPTLADALLFEPVNPLVELERLNFHTRYHDLMVRIIDEGMREGLMCDQDARLSARAVIGAVAESLMGKLTAPPSEGDKPSDSFGKSGTAVGAVVHSGVKDAQSRDETVEMIVSFCSRALGVK